jgi:c-di-GMP-binding flagellar brake protein YcgR
MFFFCIGSVNDEPVYKIEHTNKHVINASILTHVFVYDIECMTTRQEFHAFGQSIKKDSKYICISIPSFLTGAHLFHRCHNLQFIVTSEEEQCIQWETKSLRAVCMKNQSCKWQCFIARYP